MPEDTKPTTRKSQAKEIKKTLADLRKEQEKEPYIAKKAKGKK